MEKNIDFLTQPSRTSMEENAAHAEIKFCVLQGGRFEICVCILW
jgi:hypothetical protein